MLNERKVTAAMKKVCVGIGVPPLSPLFHAPLQTTHSTQIYATISKENVLKSTT